MSAFSQDVRNAIRLLRRAPGFALVAVTTLAVGIGAATAIFTVVDAVLLRPLPFVESQQLMMLRPSSRSRLSPAYFDEWRRESRTFRDMAAWHDARVNLTGRGEPLEVLVDRVTPNFFAVLGTPALVGRTFARTDVDVDMVDPEVVLSHGFWQRRFGGDSAVVGQSITLDGQRFTIVGVMPADFAVRTTELAESRAELWMPVRFPPGDPEGMGGFLHVVGRLVPGATRDQARAELGLIASRIEAASPSYSRDWTIDAVPLHDATVNDIRPTLVVLFGAVGLLLLIASANVANLVLNRTVARQSELAIRFALGASSVRIARQFLTEGGVLAGIGGIFGLLLATLGTDLLVSALPAGLDLPRTREIAVDTRVLAFVCGVTMLSAALFGLMPSLRSGRARELILKQISRGTSAAPDQQRVGNALVVVEVALALVLLAGTGLLGRSVLALVAVEPGFEPEGVITMRTTLPAARYDTSDRMRSFSRELLQRLGNLPGVQAVGTVNYLPMSRFGAANEFTIEGRPVRLEERLFSWVSTVGGRYFEAMGIPLLRGRFPDDRDTQRTEPVFVIDETLARRHWPNDDPIGRRISWPTGFGGAAAEQANVSGEIIGVVGGVRWRGNAADPNATVYWWFPQSPGPELTVVARTAGDPNAMAGAMAAQVREIDANQPVADIRALADVVSADLARPRFTMLLLGGFAAAALLLAAIGLYGVIAFGVTQRTREIGVRVALGAERQDILRLVMRRGIMLVATGLAIGAAAALASGRLVASLLFGVTPADATTFVAAAAFLTAVALLAMYAPARRATRVDPIVALRVE